MPELSQEQHPKPFTLLQKGKYVFMDLLEEQQDAGASVPYITANTIIIEEKPDHFTGDVALVRLSDLILKQSTYIDENGKHIEAHKLYTWPRNLGSTPQWTAAKRDFLNQYILNFPVEILSLQEHNGVTWRFISPEQFKKLPANINASPAFQDFAAHKDEYFFLRQPLNEPK